MCPRTEDARLREAEIDELHKTFRIEEDVLWLQVAVHDARLVHSFQARCDLTDDRARGGFGLCAFTLKQVEEGAICKQLTNKEHLAFCFKNIEHLHEIGLSQMCTNP